MISEQNYPGASRLVMEACAAAGFRPKILQTAERGHTILGLVAGNCGVALLPEPLRALPHPGVVFDHWRGRREAIYSCPGRRTGRCRCEMRSWRPLARR